MPTYRLALDLSGGSLRVLEGAPGGPMRCGEAAPPPGAFEAGRVLDPAALGQAIRQLLARSEISTTRALIAASDAIASFRVLTFPNGTPDSEIGDAVRGRLNLGSDRMAMRHIEIPSDGEGRTIFATVWDRSQVQAIAAGGGDAGVETARVGPQAPCMAPR